LDKAKKALLRRSTKAPGKKMVEGCFLVVQYPKRVKGGGGDGRQGGEALLAKVWATLPFLDLGERGRWKCD